MIAAPLGAQDAGPVRKRTMYEDLQMFSQVLNQLRINHPDTLDTHELIMAAIRGMLGAADPHSYAVTSYRLSPDKERAYRDGKLYPVPIEFRMIDGAPVVVSVAPGSSAAKTDILPGDELIEVDGNPVEAESTFELDAMLSGQRHATVRLTLDRRRADGSRVRLDRVVRRERVEEATGVPTAFLLDAQTGYVRVTTFANDKVADDLHDALSRLEKQGMRRLVLDLRDNGGGIVKQAAEVAGEFLPSKTIVYTQGGRKSEVADTGRVSRSFWSREKRYPIVVMINGGTASASELVAGALQDHDRGLIVGRPSFGKSLLMQGFPLSDGSIAVMVIGHVRTPCGRVVQRQYQGVSRHSYYALAGAVRDTAGRPSCKTGGGRTVYGGGGIYPDILFSEPAPVPLWMARVQEEALFIKWAGGHVTAAGPAYASLDALASKPHAAPGAVADFRRFATEQGVAIPEGADADALLERAIVRRVALIKWGEEGYFRLGAVLDDEVKQAVDAFGKAGELLGVSR